MMAGMAYTQNGGDRSPYGGGGGGKMRSRRAPKRNGTPYDRPAQGRHASAGPQAAAMIGTADGGKRDGWLGARLLGTASKIVTSSASYLYSSIFKRPAGGGVLLLNDVEKPAVENVEGQADMLSPSGADASLQESMEAGSQHGEEEKTASEVESWMKRTFPREEADRLIASLRSYVKENGTAEEQADNAIREEQRRAALGNQFPALESAPSNGQLSDAQRWREERTKARQEQKSNLFPGGPGKENGTPTGAGTSEAGEIVAVDVARAYMGERVTRVVTPARVTLTREKIGTPLRLSPYQPSPYLLRKQQGTSLSTQYESAIVATPFGLPAPVGVRSRDGGVDENLRTPPVSRTGGRLLPVARTNAPSSAIGYPLPGEGSKKRGSAALEDVGYSSGGPIRRLRPRSSLYTPSPASGLQRRGGLGMYPPPPRILQTPVDTKQKSITMWSRTEEKKTMTNAQQEKEDTRGSAMGAGASVPERASATARKILETLDMMTPSPKEKSLDTELALVRERPPTELTTSMINDKARQTMQSWDFPGPQELEEAGPSGRGRNLESDLSSAAGFSWKGAEQGTKTRGKGKAPASTPSHTFEEKNADHPPFSFQDTARLKVSESSLANPSPAVGRNKGFQINADVDDSDEESRGASANLLTTSVTSTTSFITGKSAPSGAGFFDNNPPRSLNVTASMFGAPVAVDSQRTTSETTLIEGKSNVASGVFTFPSSNPFGSSLEPPPTPKPFPSPSNPTGAAAKPNGLPAYKFSSGSQVFKLPSAGGDNAQTGEMKSNHQLDSKSDSLPSAVSVPETSQPFSTNPAESTREAPPTLSSSGVETPTPSSTSTAFTSSTISLANFGAPGAGAKPVFAGIFNQTTSSTLGSSSAQVTTSTSNVETSIFNFGKTPSSEPATLTPVSTGAGPNLFGSNTSASSAANTASPVFGSSSTFGTNKSPFSFGAAASSAPAPSIQATAPSATSDDGNRPQKRMFGQDQTPTGDVSAAPTVSFGLSAAATTSTSAPAGTGFTVPSFGQGASSSAPASNSTSLFGLKPTSTDSTPSTSSTPSPSLGTTAFGTTNAFGSSSPFGSSTFGSTNATPSFGGAPSTPAFGASSTPVFGASSTPSFGAASAPAFGASSAPSFGASSAPAFGASSTPAFGASSTPAFGASSTPSFGASSTPSFGASSTPAFGASSTPSFGASSTPAFGASSASAFGGSNANSKPFGGFGTEASAQPSQSPSGFAGFGTPANPASVSSPTTFSFGANAGSTPTFNFGASSAASPTTTTGAFAFGASSAASPASPFNFGAKPASPPMFGTGSSAPAFGSTPNGGMGSDMEDTMADDGQMMASSPPPQQQTSLFGAPQTPSSGTFQFGNPATPVATPSPVFGGFGNTGTPAGANPFAASAQQPTPVANPFAASPQQGQPLNFGGGGFALGSSGQEQGAKPAGRKLLKKRASSVKRK
ncbi:hypothetical protein KC19_1G310100 [Ceratodon purpureus]|uniref:Uncharacterized protein n=2 Tax=Ceratodon purpureus TaxID=3225 RepID=A0A8T0JE71_CERPU|nr:hypothetical protein KC19_1G310100 [Ceratodon purpureus]